MAIRDLQELLRRCQPVRQAGTYVFACVAEPVSLPAAAVLMSFREAEGLTLILEQSVAEAHGVPYEFPSAWITMTVTSALDAIGFTAAFAAVLGQAGISCNVVAGFHHDHLFVPAAEGERAVAVLRGLG